MFGWESKKSLQRNSTGPPPNLCLVDCNTLLWPTLNKGLFRKKAAKPFSSLNIE